MASTEVQLLNQIRENFLTQRTKQEAAVLAWAEKIKNVDPTILAGVNLPETITLQTLIPELYVQEPDPAVYKEQYLRTTALFNQVNEIADNYNKEAMRCLSEYQALTSSQA